MATNNMCHMIIIVIISDGGPDKNIRVIHSIPMSHNEIVAQVYTILSQIIYQIIARENEVTENCNTEKDIMAIHIKSNNDNCDKSMCQLIIFFIRTEI